MGSIDQAFETVDRRNFVLPEYRHRAHENQPLSIGYGQTISQPSTVRDMLGWLDVKPGQRILDVGSGSGWTTVLLAYLAKPNGHVDAVELVPELVTFGRKNCEQAGCDNTEFHQAGKSYGWPSGAPYARILVSASADKLPPELIDQLRVGGKLVIPIGNTIHEITKQPGCDLDDRQHSGYLFVPLLPKH